ncbi:MAG: UDP-N-acetylmuramate dehydrogenase [Oscillospiraceae bacterium]|nr:UDP-N-acetylmuramate dehydrogenase [Oscillospiraceae bacterium]
MQIDRELSLELKYYTGFATGGKAKAIYCPNSIEELTELLRELDKTNQKRYILGNGSNVLALDEGYDGAVILTKRFGNIQSLGNTVISDAGISLSKLCEFVRDSSLTGLEPLYGIPGTVGGAIYMNAGAFDKEIKDVLVSVIVIDRDYNLQVLTVDQCEFDYRNSCFQRDNSLIILAAKFRLATDNREDITERMNEIAAKRAAAQPLEYPSCGSTFRRPTGSYASKLIDESGLKGYSIGGAMVSTKHAGFIVNYDNATSSDILALIDEVQRVVSLKTGYELIPEIKILE